MSEMIQHRKVIVRWGLIVVLGLDVLLLAFNLKLNQAPRIAPDARGLMEIDIITAVEGDYASLVNFLDKLEHSDHFYVLDSLSLASSNAGKIRLNIQLRTYFRT